MLPLLLVRFRRRRARIRLHRELTAVIPSSSSHRCSRNHSTTSTTPRTSNNHLRQHSTVSRLRQRRNLPSKIQRLPLGEHLATTTMPNTSRNHRLVRVSTAVTCRSSKTPRRALTCSSTAASSISRKRPRQVLTTTISHSNRPGASNQEREQEESLNRNSRATHNKRLPHPPPRHRDQRQLPLVSTLTRANPFSSTSRQCTTIRRRRMRSFLSLRVILSLSHRRIRMVGGRENCWTRQEEGVELRHSRVTSLHS